MKKTELPPDFDTETTSYSSMQFRLIRAALKAVPAHAIHPDRKSVV